MPKIETVEVYNKKGHFMRINRVDFDPELHSLEKPKAKPRAKPRAKAKPVPAPKE